MRSSLSSPLPLLSASPTASHSPMLISPHPQHALPYPPLMLPTLSAVPTPPLPSSSLPAVRTPPARPATPPPGAPTSVSSTDSLCTFHTASSGFVVAHKPRNLKVLTSHGTFTLAIKVSAEKIKRRANKVASLSTVYLCAEAAEDHTGIQPGRKFNRRKHRSLIGTKAITTQPPTDSTPYLQLTGVEDDKDWLYVVETKGGETRGREKQRYVLLRMDGAYKVDIGGDWPSGGSVHLLDVVLEDHTGVVAVDYESADRREVRMKTDDEEATEEEDTEAVDEQHHRAVSYPLLSLPPYLRSFPPHSQSQPLTSLHSVQYSTAYYPATHSAPLSYSPEPTAVDEAELPPEVDEQQLQRVTYHIPAASDDEPLRHQSMFFPPIFMPPHSFTWPLYPPSSSTVHSHTQPTPPPPSMQSYPSTSSTSSSSSSTAGPTQRTLGHHIRNWSSGSASSFVSTSVPYSPSSSHGSSSSSSVSSTSSSASSTPTHYQQGSSGGCGASSRWASQQWLLCDSPAPSSFSSRTLPTVKPNDITTLTTVPGPTQTSELESGVDLLYVTAVDCLSPEPMDTDTLFSDCYSPLSNHSLTDSTAWSPTLSSTADEAGWPELPDDVELALPAAFLSLPPTPPPTMAECGGDGEVGVVEVVDDVELFCIQSVVCVSFCACVLFICLNAATEWRQQGQSLSFG